MITDTIQNLTYYRGLHPNLDSVIDWIQDNRLETLPCGKTSIAGADVYVNVMDADLLEAGDKAFEFHHLYADLQIDIDGNEYWEWSSADISAQDYNADDDIGFISAAAHADGTLGESRFVLFFPGEPHKPGCKTSSCQRVRKAVFKIRLR